ncbi:hypothetical protein U1K26_000869 [Salmonella enterica]|nr:hypothetical protein [Salmonella enterica]EMA0079606.1 hypothetical protein [Salmonella enterica]EMA5860729.1 hypothetical protein [Salmonella enterica]
MKRRERRSQGRCRSSEMREQYLYVVDTDTDEIKYMKKKKMIACLLSE